MTIKKNDSRQAVVCGYVDIKRADLIAGANKVMELPPGAVVLGANMVVSEAFNAATTATMSLGDTGNANRYANALDVRTAGVKAGAMTGYVSRATSDLILTYAETGAAATAGTARLYVQYIVEGKTQFTQG